MDIMCEKIGKTISAIEDLYLHVRVCSFVLFTLNYTLGHLLGPVLCLRSAGTDDLFQGFFSLVRGFRHARYMLCCYRSE